MRRNFPVEHATGTVLVHPSAHFVPGEFDGLDVELLDRRSAESGIPVRFQQPFDTFTPFSDQADG